MKININKEVLTLRSPHCVDMFSLFCNSNFKYTQFKSTAELNATTFRQFVLEHSLAKNCDALFRMAGIFGFFTALVGAVALSLLLINVFIKHKVSKFHKVGNAFVFLFSKTTMEYHNLHHSPQQINQQLHITSNVRQLSLIEIEQLKLQKEQLELELQLQSNLQNQDNLKSINLKVLQLQQQQQQQLQSFNNLGDYNATGSGHGNISPLGSPLPAFSCASPINDFNMSEFQEEASFEVNNNSFINTTSFSKKKVKRQSLVRQNSIVDEDNKITTPLTQAEKDQIKEAEKMRRDNLKIGFEELRQVLPRSDRNLSKLQIIIKACEEINIIKRKEAETSLMIENLRNELQRLSS
ncbi:hypothetical protein HDU92_001243 [Lobulomyces angularis]|nr:hypothetical protein HDU92_001243 [Lobulomyces angularis]